MITFCFAQEAITITTYYPSPYGSYDELATNKLAVDINGVAVASEFAAMQNGDAHIGRSLIIGAGGGSGFAYDEGATTADGTLLVKGNVGIGTPDPASKLHLQSAAPLITATSTNNDSGLRINVIGTNDDDDPIFRVFREGTNTADERFRIARDGVITMSRIAPILRVIDASTDSGLRVRIEGTDSADDPLFRVQEGIPGNNRFRVRRNGDVTLFGAAPLLEAEVGNNDSGLRINVIGLNNDTDELFRILDNGTERFNIERNGNVGIGMSPTFRLDIDDNNSEQLFRIMSSNADNGLNRPMSIRRTRLAGSRWRINSGDGFEFQEDGVSRIAFGESGRVGIGTTTTPGGTQLNVNGGHIDVTGGNFRDRDLSGGGTTSAEINTNGAIIRGASDARLKTNITSITGALSKIQRLRGVNFHYIDKEQFGSFPEMGFIAQEVEAVVPEVVRKSKDSLQLRSIKQVGIIALAIEAIKELKLENDALKERIKALEVKIK